MKYKIKNRFLVGLSAVLILVTGGGMAWAANRFVRNSPFQQYFQQSVEMRGVWDWTSTTHFDENKLRQTAHQLHLRQINTVYVDISSVADSPTQFSSTSDFSNRLKNYVSIMHKEDIAVFAAAGNVDWSKPDQQNQPLIIERYVNAFNQSAGIDQLSGIEFDIESYNQKGFSAASADDKATVLTQYLDMVNQIVSFHQQQTQKNSSFHDVRLGFAIPYWYDNENQNIPSVTWQGKTGPELYHLMDTLNQLPGSNVIVMAYRNAAAGNDGSVSHSRTEIGYAQNRAPRVKVVIGQETTNVQPAKITFYGSSMVDFSQQVNIIGDQFRISGVFGGIAVNDLPGLLSLDNGQL